MSKLNFTPAVLLSLGMLAFAPAVLAQKGGPGVEQWKSFLPYNQVRRAATDGTTFYCATSAGFFTYNREDGMLSAYSKVNGMSDIGMTGIAYDGLSRNAVLAYSSSSVDLFKDGGFYNIPALKLFPVSGDKTINDVIAGEGQAYLSTGIGLVILNLSKREVKETIFFFDNTLTASVHASLVDNGYLYAATSVGLFRIPKDDPGILNYTSWTKLSAQAYSHLGSTGGHIYASTADSLYELQGNAMVFAERLRVNDTGPAHITHMDAGAGGLWISVAKTDGSAGFAILRNTDGSRTDSLATPSPSQVMQLASGEVWFGDDAGLAYPNQRGLRKRTAVDRSEAHFPDGPVSAGSFDVSARNGEFWIAHGGKTSTWNVTSNRAMFSRFKDDRWDNIAYQPGNEWVQDFIRILHDFNSGTTYAGSFSGGLVERPEDGQSRQYGTGYFDDNIGNPGLHMISGLALDEGGNLWITNFQAEHELVVKKRDGNWKTMRSIEGNSAHSAADVIIDDYGQKWFIAVTNGGVVVYNDNNTIDNTADDQYRIMKSGSASGNLPDNNTLSIVKDKDGAIWIGTENGIGIINCPGEAVAGNCAAELRVVQEDQFAGYLFEGQAVRTMAVDGANRKWIGTSNGVWLLSEDAKQTIYRFTEENSPLPSNSIERINIDPVTGDVYFSTDKGLASFRSTATEGNAQNDEKLYIYPNPVPSGYGGMIAVRGVAENSDVRFTDISGQLVYRTQALGGQAVWNGKDYTGHKVQSGVYLVFVVNKDGTQKATGKIIIHH